MHIFEKRFDFKLWIFSPYKSVVHLYYINKHPIFIDLLKLQNRAAIFLHLPEVVWFDKPPRPFFLLKNILGNVGKNHRTILGTFYKQTYRM